MAQKVYRAALRSRCGTIRVHTAALGICLIRTESMLSRADSLSLARDIHRDVMVCLYCTRKGSDRGNPQSTIKYCTENIHTHSNGTTAPSP